MPLSYFERELARNVSPFWQSEPLKAESALEEYRARLAKMQAEYSLELIDFLLSILEKRYELV